MPYSFFFITPISPKPITNYTPSLYALFYSTDRPKRKLYPDVLLSHTATNRSTCYISELSFTNGLHLFLSSWKTSGAANYTIIILSPLLPLGLHHNYGWCFAPSTIKDNVPEQLCGLRDTLPSVSPSVESTPSVLGLLILHIFSSQRYSNVKTCVRAEKAPMDLSEFATPTPETVIRQDQQLEHERIVLTRGGHLKSKSTSIDIPFIQA